MCGWIQVIRSTDNSSGGVEFELDPFGPFTETGSPYAFYGLAPTLFDGPGRDARDDLGRSANDRSGLRPREIVALLTSSWAR